MSIKKTLWLISTIIWDNLAITFITLIFDKSRFLNISNQYKFTYSFFCIYNVFSGLLMPNFAMERAFKFRTENQPHEVSKDIAIYLIDGLYSNFKNLIFSAANYKILQPVVVSRLRKFARRVPKMIRKYRKKKTKSQSPPASVQSGSFDLIAEMKRIKEETRQMQTAQEKENDALIFGLGFMTNCFFNVCFYGLFTPSVFLYLMPAFCMFVAFDFAKFKLKKESVMRGLKESIRKSFKNVQAISLSRSKRFSTSTKQKASGIQAQIKQHAVQEVPWTIFISFLYMLLLGGFPLTTLGYFGMAKRFSKFLVIQQPLLKSARQQSLFFRMYDSTFKLVDKFCQLVFNESAIVFVESFTRGFREVVKETLQTLKGDSKLILVSLLYVAILVIVLMFFRVERYINRIQSRIWKSTKTLDREISGESFRQTNPAYKIIK